MTREDKIEENRTEWNRIVENRREWNIVRYDLFYDAEMCLHGLSILFTAPRPCWLLLRLSAVATTLIQRNS